MIKPPKDIGSAVPEGFRLPHNTTRTMADVWRDEHRRERYRNLLMVHRAATNAPQVKITPAGKIAYAGYEGSEA